MDERELSDSEDEEGDKRRDRSEAKQISKKRKTSSEAVNGTLEILSAVSTEPATVTQVTTVNETTVIMPSTTDETMATAETVTETTTVVVVENNISTETPPNDGEISE